MDLKSRGSLAIGINTVWQSAGISRCSSSCSKDKSA